MSAQTARHPDPVSAPTKCRGCGALIVFVSMGDDRGLPNGKTSPCDVEVIEGDFKQNLVTIYAARKNEGAGWRGERHPPLGRVFTKAPPGIFGRISHFATCAKAADFKRPKS